jgi:hypothetical protein
VLGGGRVFAGSIRIIGISHRALTLMAFSFTSSRSSLDDFDMLFNIEPVPFFEVNDTDMDGVPSENTQQQRQHRGSTIESSPQTSYLFQGGNENNLFVNPICYNSMKMEVASSIPARGLYSDSYLPFNTAIGGESSSHGSIIGTKFPTEEDLLAQPVSSLTEEEKKIRRRAQVAKSARKHRKGLKEELEMLRQQVKYLQEQMSARQDDQSNHQKDATSRVDCGSRRCHPSSANELTISSSTSSTATTQDENSILNVRHASFILQISMFVFVSRGLLVDPRAAFVFACSCQHGGTKNGVDEHRRSRYAAWLGNG